MVLNSQKRGKATKNLFKNQLFNQFVTLNYKFYDILVFCNFYYDQSQ